jgi:thioredoxin-like negative regulator of GroEL
MFRWCPPCKALGPLIKTWIQAKGGKVKLILVDVDEADEVAAKLGVEAMPTVYGYYKGGEYKSNSKKLI